MLGGYNRHQYKHIREKINNFIYDEIREEGIYQMESK